MPPPSPPGEKKLWPGDSINGQYFIARLLGKGGSGVVYLAHDTVRSRLVALKFVLGNPSEDDLKRLNNEVDIGQKVRHLNFGPVIDMKRTPDGTYFLSMDFIEGEDLVALLRQNGKPPVDLAIRIAIQLCNGLRYLHEEKGYIHCDLKLDNVMLHHQRLVKITDFGLTMPIGTKSRTPEGTMHYMAPERWLDEPLLPPVDVYAVGAILFELLTGTRCLPGKDAKEVRANYRTAAVRKPSGVTTDLGDRFDAVVLSCLQVNAADRPTVTELRADLELLANPF